MTKQQWIAHIEEAHGVTCHLRDNPYSPIYTEHREAWKSAVAKCIDSGCPQCKDRQKTRKRSRAARAREDAYRSCGLTKVIGPVSCSVYWE